MRNANSLAPILLLAIAGCTHDSGQPRTAASTEPSPPIESQELKPASLEEPIEPGISPTNAPTDGTLPVVAVIETLSSANAGIAACYERALQAKPDLSGKVNINIVVGEDGRVAHAEAMDVEEPLPDPKVVECVLAEIRKLQFPAPKGGRLFLNYPLRFEAQKSAASP